MELLVRKYGLLLQRFILGYLRAGREEDVEEVLDDTLLSIWRDVEEYDPPRARFKTWVFMKARYCALERRRKLVRESQRTCPLPPVEISQSQPDLALRIDVALALSRMSALDRQIFYLCDYLGWDRQEAADRLGMKRGALNVRLHRIRRQLRRLLRSRSPAGRETADV